MPGRNIPRNWKSCGAALVAANLVLGPVLCSAKDIAVDVELVLAVDVSMSMMAEELAIQRTGYAAALTDPLVMRAIVGGAHRRIALIYVEWAGANEQNVIIPWTVLENPAGVAYFAERLGTAPSYRSFRTSISDALGFSASLFDGNGIASATRIIDISGDGANNEGSPVANARDAAVAAGITINGLPLMTDFGLVSSFDVADLDDYYAECVIGGPGAFSIPVKNWEQFAEAVRRKLVLEITGTDPLRVPPIGPQKLLHAALQTVPYDCLAGEKLWNRQQGGDQ